MLYRKTILFLSSLILLMSAGCTTRYQDMLRDRDTRIHELNNEIARLRGENEDLLRRESAAQSALRDASAKTPRNDSELDSTQNALGGDAKVSYRGGRLSIGVNDSVTFDSGSTGLKDSAHKVLKNVASLLKQKYAGKRIYVEGHTDTDPLVKTKDKYRDNRQLSYERADAVTRYLVSQGVPEASIAVVGYGQFDPISSNKSQNRRVEIVIGDAIR